jgi:methylmalonyl-CoA/ethylmalonyl-CoA epimerase
MSLYPLRLHHIGYVVANIDSAMNGFLRSLGADWDGRVFEDPHQRVKVAFLTTRPGDAQVELVEPASEDSPVKRFLEERGGGLHHACYEVADLAAQLAEFRSRGAVIAKRPKPAVAFSGRHIAWIITSEKMLIELLEESLPDSPGMEQ